jgi:hypothetical protein
LDIEKFYDHVPWSTVVNTAYAVGYPLVVLALGLQLHQAPRRVATDDAVSERLWPRRGLCAGAAFRPTTSAA